MSDDAVASDAAAIGDADAAARAEADAANSRAATFIAKFMGAVPHLKTLGIAYRAHGDGWAELELPYAPHLIVDDGVIASGAIFSLMDSAAGFAVFTRLKSLVGHATIDLRLDYPRGPVPGVTIIARAICYRITSSIAFVRGFAHQGDPAVPIANMAGTFIHGGVA